MFKTAIWVAVIVAALAAAAWGAQRWWASRAQSVAAQPVSVRAEPAALGTLTETISASGEVDAKTKVSISARVSARINELPFKIGDRVTKGDPAANPPVPPSVLVRLDSKDLEAQLKSVEARYKAEQASLEVSRSQVATQAARIDSLKIMLADAKRELDRKSKLLASHDISQSEVDQLQAKVEQQEAEMVGAAASLEGQKAGLVVLQHQIEAAEAEIAKARDNLAYATITSPIDGVVTRLNAEVGEVVMTGTMNNAGTVILEVADLSQVVLRAFVDESAIAQVREKQTANVRLEAYRDKVFKGVVQSVALANYDASMARGGAARNANTGGGGKTFEVVILIDTDGHRFFSGLSADAEIETKRFESVIRVPSQAVLARSPDSLPERVRSLPVVEKGKASVPVVYRYVDGKAVATPVRIGSSDMTHTVIEEGLSAGDLVITGPYKALEPLADGQQVKGDVAATSESTTTSPSTTPATSPTS